MSKRRKAPGKAHRKGVTLIQLFEMFPDEQAAEKWFEETLWPEERCCGHCGSTKTHETKNRKPMPYRCRDCRRFFSIRTGTTIAKTNLSLQKWAIAIYLELTNLKGISSMKLHCDIGVSQPSAWFMLHRIREAWHDANTEELESFTGPVEVDEAYFGGRRRNMHKAKRKQLTGRGPTGKTAVAGIKDRKSKPLAIQTR